jgi:hypothetical protein
MAVTPKKITVTVDLTVSYKAVMQGSNVLVLDASLDETYYPLTMIPMEARQVILNAITEQVRIDDYESRFPSELESFLDTKPGLTE